MAEICLAFAVKYCAFIALRLINGETKYWDLYYGGLVYDPPMRSTVAILKALDEAGHRIILCTYF